MNVQLIPDDFRNSTFQENLELLSTAYPEIYELVKDHKPNSHRICLNPDGTPNVVHMPDKSVLYPTSGEEIDRLHEQTVLGMARRVNFSKTYLLQDEDLAAKNSHVQNAAYSGLLNITPLDIKQIVDAEGHIDHRIEVGDETYIPFVRVHGIGLGTQLLKLLKEKTVVFVSIIEPNVDLFFSSLFVTPWRVLHQYFSVRGSRMSLIVGDTPEDSIKKENAFIKQNFPFLISNFGRLTMIGDEAVQGRLLSAEGAEDSASDKSSSAGWYDDQKIGLYHSLCNIREQRPFFTGKKITDFLRVFVIGTGPSLDESISYIRQNCDQAVIFACGSAISPLLAEGIIPDFHVIQERMWTKDSLRDPQTNALLKQVRLLKLNVVSPENDSLYRETYTFQKFMDPGSALLGAGFPATQGVNPTVTNAGVAFAIELGADEVYLFGVDYGSPAGKGAWHSTNTRYDKDGVWAGYDDEVAFEVRGNFAEPAITTPMLSWSRQVTETLFGRNKHAKYFNVGSGAYIAGAAECRVENLSDLSSLPNLKRDVVSRITACFSDEYISRETFQFFDQVHRPSIAEYLDSLRIFHDTVVATREEITDVLSMLYGALDVGLSTPDFIPSSLLNGGIKRLIENVHLQSSLAASDAEAVKFFERAKVVLDNYYADVLKDLDHIVESAKSGVDVVNWS